MAFKLDRLDQHTWTTFVRPSVKLKHSPSTKAIIEAIMPYFPKECHCIGGYLNDSDQFWKINYHWELLVRLLTKALSITLQPQSRGQVETIKKRLLGDPPNPGNGYADSKVIGQPHDKTPAEGIVRRWQMLRTCKQEFRLILDLEEIPKKHPPSTPWDLCVAPVAKPGTSKHGMGYALDIEGKGNNELIKQIGKALNATLTFDEKSHVHIEFKQGVVIEGHHVADDKHDGQWAGWRQTGAKGALMT